MNQMEVGLIFVYYFVGSSLIRGLKGEKKRKDVKHTTAPICCHQPVPPQKEGFERQVSSWGLGFFRFNFLSLLSSNLFRLFVLIYKAHHI